VLVNGKLQTDDDKYEPNEFGRKPWRIFLLTTLIFAFLWSVSGVIITLQLFGLVGDYLPAELQQDKVLPSLVELGRNPEYLHYGQQIATAWPHGNINPVGLACDGASKTMVVSTRFGLYTADLSSPSRIQFATAPACEGVEGETLQDVSLQCKGATCQAHVLHQNGHRVVACALSEGKTNTTEQVSSTSITGQWLNGRKASENSRVESLAMKSQCSGQCTYLGTSDRRVIEMQESADSEGSNAFFPKRLLGTKASVTASVPGGAMDLINDRYLGMLQRDGRRLQVIDTQNGALSGMWQLPHHPDGKTWIPERAEKTWTAMCSAGDDLYLLSKGLSPQLWRFPVPEELRLAAAAGREATE